MLPTRAQTAVLWALLTPVIVLSAWILGGSCQSRTLCLLVGVLYLLSISLWIGSVVFSHSPHPRLILSLVGWGILFVLLSGLIFSFYFEIVELWVGRRGFSQIGRSGWALVLVCILGLLVFKAVLTRLREKLPIGFPS